MDDQDKLFVSELLKIIETEVSAKQILRLSKDETSKRPIKMIMNSHKEKKLIIANRKILKNAIPKFHNRSIREDQTQDQRRLVNKYAELEGSSKFKKQIACGENHHTLTNNENNYERDSNHEGIRAYNMIAPAPKEPVVWLQVNKHR